MTDLVAINGQIFSQAAAQVPSTDRVFLFGDGLVETICASGSHLLDLSAHLERLRRAAQLHHISLPWPDSLLQFEMENLLSLTRYQRSSIRLIVSRGLDPQVWPTPESSSPQRYIYCSRVRQVEAEELSQGIRLKVKKDPSGRRGEQTKCTFYLPSIVATLESRAEGYDEIVWCNGDGEFTEAGSANIFFIAREGDLVEIATPPLQAGILPGITRSRIIELLTRSKIPVRERPIPVEELARFDEAFLSSSVRGLFPIQAIDKHRLHSCRPQAVFRQIHRLYKSWEENEGGNRSGGSAPITSSSH